jgi:hypothetical protein
MLKSRRINKWVLCLILACGGGFFAVAGMSQATQDEASGTAYTVKGIVNGRLQIPPLTQPLKLEEENEIPILLHGYKVHSADASWSYYYTNSQLAPEDDAKELTVMYHEDGSAYVKIVPEKLGKLQIAMAVYFEDGGGDVARVDGEVVYPDRKPEKAYVTTEQRGDFQISGTIYLDLSERSKMERLLPRALYKGAAHPVPIPLADVGFKLTTTKESDPPISIDNSTGIITALHIGHALIQTTFQGFSVLTCVDVMKNASDGSDRTVCPELVPAGMTAPLTGFEHDGPLFGGHEEPQ